ncbi:activator-dependent family glycosyltransferase [Streptomyces sp. GS7]|uniref:activator-dependent family glycosyltransferase n=1 Tax=Streptomyces sp. GS7 TaxID=2692234 RepID=UPI0013184F1C|nr:activator-dependent family glycosyltransferase [Streptomyces sp. GS7]QHC20452.1 activator-dependent family glycosyltransferase [Streptomyces sp. GS7]
MRVLIVTYAEKTHYLHMVSMAWALAAAGHEVRVASQPALADTITASGLTAVPVGEDHQLLEMAQAIARENPQAFNMGPSFGGLERPRTTWERERGVYEALVPYYLKIANNPSFVDGLVDFARHWRPDLVLWEQMSYAGAVAARAVGAAHARVLWSPDFLGRQREMFLELREEQPEDQRVDPLGEWLAGELERHGLDFDEQVVTGQFTIDPTPAGARLPLKLHTVPVRYVPYNGVAVVPDWLREPPARPRVCVTMGLSRRRYTGHDGFPVSGLKAFADLDIEVVTTLIPIPGEETAEVPANTRVVDFVPMHALLPTCDAVVHYGGSGTWMAAMLHGVPQLLVPQSGDTFIKAEHMERYGSGLVVPADEADDETLRAALVRLLEEPSFRQSAARLREEVLAVPSPGELVPTLEKLTAEYRTSTETS